MVPPEKTGLRLKLDSSVEILATGQRIALHLICYQDPAQTVDRQYTKGSTTPLSQISQVHISQENLLDLLGLLAKY